MRARHASFDSMGRVKQLKRVVRAGRRLRTGLPALLLALPILGSGCAARQNLPFTPIQLALVPGAEVFAKETPVRGARVNVIYGVQQDVIGLDVGLVNDVSESVTGVGLGVLNIAHKRAAGLAVGMGNSVGEDFLGAQLGAVNQVAGDFTGAQVGLGNFAQKGSGVQMGIINIADSLKGAQVGLININRSGWLPFLPGINISP